MTFTYNWYKSNKQWKLPPFQKEIKRRLAYLGFPAETARLQDIIIKYYICIGTMFCVLEHAFVLFHNFLTSKSKANTFEHFCLIN